MNDQTLYVSVYISSILDSLHKGGKSDECKYISYTLSKSGILAQDSCTTAVSRNCWNHRHHFFPWKCFDYIRPDWLYSLVDSEGIDRGSFFSQAAMVAAIFSIGIFVHILWKAAQLFRSLHKGQSPFSVKFISRLRYLAYILFAADFLTSAVFSSSLSILASNAYHLELSLGSPFLIGLVLIVTVKVFEYGIALQNLAE